MNIGYAALTTGNPTTGIVEPHTALIAAGVQRLFIDVVLGDAARTQLDAAIEAIGQGDVLVSASIETLARSPRELISIANRLDAKGAAMRVLQIAGGLPLDTRTVEGRAMLGALAIMHALQPIDPTTTGDTSSLTQDARPRGRPATAVVQSGEVTRLRAEGLRATDIASRLGIGRASVYRILNQGGSVAVEPTRDSQLGRAASLARRLHQANGAD